MCKLWPLSRRSNARGERLCSHNAGRVAVPSAHVATHRAVLGTGLGGDKRLNKILQRPSPKGASGKPPPAHEPPQMSGRGQRGVKATASTTVRVGAPAAVAVRLLAEAAAPQSLCTEPGTTLVGNQASSHSHLMLCKREFNIKHFLLLLLRTQPHSHQLTPGKEMSRIHLKPTLKHFC